MSPSWFFGEVSSASPNASSPFRTRASSLTASESAPSPAFGAFGGFEEGPLVDGRTCRHAHPQTADNTNECATHCKTPPPPPHPAENLLIARPA